MQDECRLMTDAKVKPLFDAMASRVTPDEMSLMHRAYDVAYHAHDGQKRKSGEPYIIHPIAVARIVGEEMELDPYTVCAAFLHDVVEDTPYTIEQVQQVFGERVAYIVDAVTKKKKKSYDTSKQVDNFKHMLDAVNHDISALLLKLADRLHNMRTLNSMPPAKQMKIAGETDFFYAPLAFRLGLYNVKTELENLSFKYRCPREYAQLDHLLAVEEQAIKPHLEDFKQVISSRLAEAGIKAEVVYKTRRPYSIMRKMLRKNVDFAHLQRIHSVHIIYEPLEGDSEKATAVRIYEVLTNAFREKPHSVTNYIDNPKENGYQSLHVHVLASNAHWQEVRISSHRMARAQVLGCIYNPHDTKIASWLDRLRNNMADMSQNCSDISFMDGVRSSFYHDDIIAYTYDGRVISLPEKASVLDFAFEAFGNEGIHAEYARINGKLSSVFTQLERGDIVDVGLNPDVYPKSEWLDHVLTYKAKRYLKSWLDTRPKKTQVRCEHCLPLPGDEVIGFKLDDGTIMVHKRDCAVAISQASQHGDSVVAVDFVDDGTPYLVNFHIRAVDRYHLLSDIIDCITDNLHLSIDSLKTVTKNHIVDCFVNFFIFSHKQLQTAIETINAIPGVQEVCRPTAEECNF